MFLSGGNILLLVILILLTSELGLILSQLSHFSITKLALLTGAFLGITLVLGRSKLKLSIHRKSNDLLPSPMPASRQTGRDRQPAAFFPKKKKQILLFLPVAAIAGILFFQPYEYMDGGWDPGGYINTGVHIARTGSVLYHDELLAQMDKSDQEMLCGFIRNDGTGIKYPGLYIKNIHEGLIVPQFFHLYPVWIAIFYKLAGLRAAFYVNPFFALCSVILIFFIGQRIGRNYGFLTAFLLAVNIIQIWNARFSTSEVLAQFLLLSGFYFWIRYLDSKDGFMAFCAGLAMGEFLLVSVTSLLIIPVVITYLIFRTNKKDIYFALPFFLILAHLVIQLCTFSSIYFESVIRFFRHKEIYLCAGTFLLVLSSIPFLKKMPSRYLKFPLASLIAGVFIYGYLIRPHIVSSIEALNLVELSRFLSPAGLAAAVIGLVLLTCREKREDILFFVITGLIAAVFFIYGKRMYSRYPFALRRYIPAVIPVYCFCISYFCFFLNRYRIGRFFSIAVICLVATMPFKICRDIIPVRNYHGSLDFWKGFASQLDDDAVYISNRYRWARPLTDIFGKQVLAFSGVPEFGGEKIAGFARKLIENGKKVHYISDLPKPYLLSVDFIEVCKKFFGTEYLEDSLTFPPVVKPLNLCFKVFRVIPIEESGMPKAEEYNVDIGAGNMGLLCGFDKARRFGGIPEYARWTLSKAELVIPWFGEGVAQTLTMFASGMPERAGSTYISLHVENLPVIEGYCVGEGLKEHEFFIPAGSVKTGDKKRVVLTIESNTWNPGEYGIKGYPSHLGIKIYWIKINMR